MHLEKACVQERHMYLGCREPAWTRPQDPKRFYKDHRGGTFRTGTETILPDALQGPKSESFLQDIQAAQGASDPEGPKPHTTP